MKKTTWALALLPLALAACADGATGPEDRPACSQGLAADFDCSGVNLLGFLSIPDLGGPVGGSLNDIWGWTDPSTGQEYALVARDNGTAFVDVTDPTAPVLMGDLPLTPGASPSGWRDIKVYADHAFVVADNAGQHGVQIFDLTRLRGVTSAPELFSADAVYDGVGSAHNIAIDTDAGLAAVVGASSGAETCGGGLHLLDVTTPQAPAFAGCFTDTTTAGGDGHSHDAQCVTYHGPDTRYTGRQICLGANEDAISIADVTDPANGVSLASASYPAVGYAHQGWLTDDHRYFYSNDELDEQFGLTSMTRTLIWDLQTLDDPVLVGEYTATTRAIDHNLYIRGDTMYQANYAAGLRVLDISDRDSPTEVGYFDTTPGSGDAPVFAGAWSVYPFFESGTLVVSSIDEGLFVFEVAKE